MISQDTLSELSLNRSYQQGWDISLREFNAQQAIHSQEQFSVKHENTTLELERYANKHTDNQYA